MTAKLCPTARSCQAQCRATRVCNTSRAQRGPPLPFNRRATATSLARVARAPLRLPALPAPALVASARFQVPAERVLVLYDDLDLPNAQVRLRAKGGHGGHNGMKSISGERPRRLTPPRGALGWGSLRSAPGSLWKSISHRTGVTGMAKPGPGRPSGQRPSHKQCLGSAKLLLTRPPVAPALQPTCKVPRTSRASASASAARPAACPSLPGCFRWGRCRLVALLRCIRGAGHR